MEWCPPGRRNEKPRNSWIEEITTVIREWRGLITWNGSTNTILGTEIYENIDTLYINKKYVSEDIGDDHLASIGVKCCQRDEPWCDLGFQTGVTLSDLRFPNFLSLHWVGLQSIAVLWIFLPQIGSNLQLIPFREHKEQLNEVRGHGIGKW